SERGNRWPPCKNAGTRGAWFFRFRRLQHFVTIGEVEKTEAQREKARYEYLLKLAAIKERTDIESIADEKLAKPATARTADLLTGSVAIPESIAMEASS